MKRKRPRTSTFWAAASPEHHTAVWNIERFRKRILWLALLFVAGAITSNILQHYEEVLGQMIALTFFIPLLIDTGGNAGAQTSTMVIRAMVLGDVGLKNFLKVIFREMRLGLALGAAMAAVGFAWSRFLQNPNNIAFTISATIVTLVTVSSTVGAAMPVIGKRLGLDRRFSRHR